MWALEVRETKIASVLRVRGLDQQVFSVECLWQQTHAGAPDGVEEVPWRFKHGHLIVTPTGASVVPMPPKKTFPSRLPNACLLCFRGGGGGGR